MEVLFAGEVFTLLFIFLCVQQHLKREELQPRKVEPFEQPSYPGVTDSQQKRIDDAERRAKNLEYRAFLVRDVT